MTWERIIDSVEGGNGGLEYRLVIEGFDYSFVTDQEMTNLNIPIKRINGLLRKGINLNQSVQFPESKLKLNGNTFTVVDYQEKATEAFYRKPTFQATIRREITTTDTIIFVSNTKSLASGDYVWVGSECMLVNSLVIGQNKVFVSRAQMGTTAQKHVLKSQFGTMIRPTIQNVPFTIENRRVYLYAYGLGDDLQGEGTLIWRGFVLTDVVNNGTNYTIETGPITEILKSTIGIDDGTELSIRGINLGNYRWAIKINEFNVSANKYLPISSEQNEGIITIQGFFESIEQLADRINQSCVTLTTSWSTKVGATVTNTGELIFIVNHTSSTRAVSFETIKNPGAENEFADLFDFESGYGKEYKYNGVIQTSNVSNTFTTTDTYAVRLKPKSTFPIPFMFYSPAQVNVDFLSPASFAYGRRFYLANYSVSSLLDTFKLVDSEGKTIAQVLSRDFGQFSINTTLNYIDCILSFNSEQPIVTPIDPNSSKIILGTSFGCYRDTSGSYNFIDFLNYLISISAQYCNIGVIPLLTTDDFDLDDMQLVFDEIGLPSYLNNRTFAFFKKTAKLEDILNEELKLIGCFLALTSDGKLTIRRLRNINPYEQSDYTIDSDDILTDTDYIQIRKNEFGIFNSVNLFTGYNGVTQKHEGRTYTFNNIDSISQFNKQKAIELKPYFDPQQVPSTLGISEIEDLRLIMLKAISLFSRNYEVYTIELPMKYFNINIGSTIRIKNKQVPNWGTGNPSYTTTRRGSARILGNVVAKDFNLEKGYGKIKVLVSDQEFAIDETSVKAIFAPDFLSNTVTQIGTGLYTLTPSTSSLSYVMPSGQTLSDYLNVYDGLRFDQFDSSTANNGQGKIIAISGTGNNLTLTLDFNNGGSVPTGFTTSGNQFMCRISDYNSIFTTDDQKKYGFYDGGFLGTDNENFPANILNRILAF